MQRRVASSADYLGEHLGDAPVLVLACNEGPNREWAVAGMSNVIPATWSFMLAARARALGTAWTSMHLARERDVAEIPGTRLRNARTGGAHAGGVHERHGFSAGRATRSGRDHPLDLSDSCLAYDDVAVTAGWAQQFPGAGLTAGERIVFVASGTAGMTDWLAEAAGGDTRAVRFEPLDDAYGAADPEALVTAWAAETEAALADGHTGLRVFADTTPLVRSAEQLELDDLIVAVSEVVTNAHRYGHGPVGLRIWAGADRIVVTVVDAGSGPADPFAGFLPVNSEASAGLGLWITHQACSHVRMHRGPNGFTIRLTAGIPYSG